MQGFYTVLQTNGTLINFAKCEKSQDFFTAFTPYFLASKRIANLGSTIEL